MIIDFQEKLDEKNQKRYEEYKDIINELLESPEFQENAETDIGKIDRVKVNWNKNSMTFFGTNAIKELKISETLKTLGFNYK